MLQKICIGTSSPDTQHRIAMTSPNDRPVANVPLKAKLFIPKPISALEATNPATEATVSITFVRPNRASRRLYCTSSPLDAACEHP